MAVIYTVNSANFRKSYYIIQRNSGQFNPFIVRVGREQQFHLKTTTKKFLDWKILFQRRFSLKPLRHPQLSSRDCRISTIGIPMNSRLVGKMRPTHKLKGRGMLEATDVLEKNEEYRLFEEEQSSDALRTRIQKDYMIFENTDAHRTRRENDADSTYGEITSGFFDM